MSDLLDNLSQHVKSMGNQLLPYFANVDPMVKEDGSWLTVADQMAHDSLMSFLPTLIDLPVLSEELSSTSQQQIIDDSTAGYWCVDPLDGTSNFTQGIGHWCISVGLVVDGAVKLGVVHDPNRGDIFAAEDHEISTVNGQPIHNENVGNLQKATALVDFKRLPQSINSELILSPPYRSQRNFGASALDICWLADNRCQVYLHGKQRLWDYIAASKILHNAGGLSETFTGEAVFSNDLEDKTIIAASTATLMSQWCDYFHSIN